MSVLRTTWEGELCHKTKAIAEVRALAGQDLPIPIPSQLDVHQKVKFAEFRDKVVNKSSGKLSFETYVSHDEHLLLVTLIEAKTGLAVLESFNNFLYKSQSVGVSVIGENGSVLFLVPAKLDPGGLFPIFPHTEESEEPTVYGVIKLSKSLVPTLEPSLVKTEDSTTKVKEEKVCSQNSEQSPVQVSDKTDYSLSSTSSPSRDLTRLSVYMSNLPALHRPDREPEKPTPEEAKEKKRLSLSQYRQRHDGSKEDGGESNIHRNGDIRDNHSVRSDSGIDSEMDQTSGDTETLSETAGVLGAIESPRGNTKVLDAKGEAEALDKITAPTSYQTTVSEQVDNAKGSSDIPTSQNFVHETEVYSHKTQNASLQNESVIQNGASGNSLVRQVFRSEPMLQTASQYSTVNSANENLSNVPYTDIIGSSGRDNSTSLSTKAIPLDMPTEAAATELQPLKVVQDVQFVSHQIPEQRFHISPDLLLKTDKESGPVNPVATIKTERDDSYSRYTVIEPMEIPEKEQPKDPAASAIQNYLKTDLFGDGLDQDLPDLTETNDIPEDQECTMNPGESVNFKKTESVVFTPVIYGKILDDLDTLKLLLGDTAMRNSTAHREQCMLMVDKIGDRLIGNRTRKTCITRSVGSLTDGRNQNPSKEVQTELDNDLPEEVIAASEKGRDNQKNKAASTNQKENRKKVSVQGSNEPDKTSDVTSGKEAENKNKRTTNEADNGQRSNKKRKKTDSSDNTDEEAEGYFTMLLKLNGALDDEKRRCKTVRRVHKTVRRITTSNKESREPESGPPQIQEIEERFCTTPETGTSAHEPGSVRLIDGHLVYKKPENYTNSTNTRGIVEEPTHSVSNTTPGSTSYWPHQMNQPALPWHGTEVAKQTTYNVTETQLTSGAQHNIEQSLYTIQNQPVEAVVNNYHGYPAEHGTVQEYPQDSNTPNYGTSAQSSSQTQPYGSSELPTNSLESDIQKSLNDVDLRQVPYTGQVAMPATSTSFPAPTNGIMSYENTVSTSVMPSEDNTSNTTTTVNTTTESSAYYTDSTVTVYNQEQVIDQEMESEMIDILEILHEGSAPETITLKKPKGRSKRARKKRRAIAEAEKLYSMVVMAQKIEKQQKLNVLSEKQKKREFYKKIINTYAGKWDQQAKPKDEETMILECVEQLMDNPSDTEEGSTKTESSDQVNKKKGTEDITVVEECDKLSEASAGTAKTNVVVNVVDDLTSQITETVRHERSTSDQAVKRDRASSKNLNRPKRESTSRTQRSLSRDKSLPPSPERHRREKSRSSSPGKLRSDKRRRNICYEPDPSPEVVPMTPEAKNKMFQSWSHKRYMSHLFATANKITFGSESNKSWNLKVFASVKAIGERKKVLTDRIEDIKTAMRSSKSMSFKERDRAEHQKQGALGDLKDFETLEALFEFYACKFGILEVLQHASQEKLSDPINERLILHSLCQKLDRQLDNLRRARELLDLQMRLNLSISDRRLVCKASSECIDMIENIRKETRKHKEQGYK